MWLAHILYGFSKPPYFPHLSSDTELLLPVSFLLSWAFCFFPSPIPAPASLWLPVPFLVCWVISLSMTCIAYWMGLPEMNLCSQWCLLKLSTNEQMEQLLKSTMVLHTPQIITQVLSGINENIVQALKYFAVSILEGFGWCWVFVKPQENDIAMFFDNGLPVVIYINCLSYSLEQELPSIPTRGANKSQP